MHNEIEIRIYDYMFDLCEFYENTCLLFWFLVNDWLHVPYDMLMVFTLGWNMISIDKNKHWETYENMEKKQW